MDLSQTNVPCFLIAAETMIKLIFATNNEHKIHEMQAAIGKQVLILSLKAAGITIDIEEPYDTLEENARIKTATIHRMTGINCFGEDSGLEVTALGGAPGVKSARYAGEGRNHADNIRKLLQELKHSDDRSACFRTVISLIWNEREYQFQGRCNGSIIQEPRGDMGFGYDPVFIPSGSKLTFAEMTMEEKNRFSHRKKAADRLVLFLQQIVNPGGF